jgi:N,N'-diacetylchitobiose transport system permease protein
MSVSSVVVTPSIDRRRKRRAPYLLLIPAIAILVLGLGYPLVWQAITSLQEYGLSQQFGKPAPFVGFENYIKLATNGELWAIVARSLVFCLVTAFITMAVGTLLALLMNVITKTARLILQVALLLAWSMPVVAAMTVWIWLFDRRRGVVNYLLDMIPGVEMNRYDWLSHPSTFFALASLIVLWMSVPFVAFCIYAGLTQVSDEILEAAQLDGASPWQRFWYIIAPMIRPVIAIVLPLLKDAGSKSGDYDLLGTYIYKLGTSSQDFGMASAVSIFVLAITIALSWFYIRSLLKEDES